MDQLKSWAVKEVSPWLDRKWSSNQLIELSHRTLPLFILSSDGARVSILQKTGLAADHPDHAEHPFVKRILMYRDFFADVVREFEYTEPFMMAINVEDECLENEALPVFSFQKERGHKTLLLPDSVFLVSNYYSNSSFWSIPDPVDYYDKMVSAVFVGSTTGRVPITMMDLDAGLPPRIRAARFFRHRDGVEFYLPNIVQCENKDVYERIKAEDFGSHQFTWRDQLNHRFLISMDGNGAACSRFFLSLVSNCVPLKYYYVNELFYFHGLNAKEHFVLIESDQDILDAVARELICPGFHANIARAGREFASRYLTRTMLQTYGFELLRLYNDINKRRDL